MTWVAAAQALELRRLGSLAHGPAPAAAAGGSEEEAELDGDGRLWEDDAAAVLTIRYDGATQRRRSAARRPRATTGDAEIGAGVWLECEIGSLRDPPEVGTPASGEVPE